MSTGDQSQYVRAKLAERGSRAEASFMEDGFDRWAESTAPAREGQMEKIPAESQMAGRGGAMTLSKAKQKLLKLEGLHGGIIEVPQAVKDAAKQAKALIDVWRGISSRVDSFMMELQDQVIDDPASSASLVTFAKKVQEWFSSLKQYKDILDGAAQLASSVGLGKKGQVRGGAMSWTQLADYAKQIASIYFYLKTNAGNIRKLLGMNSLQPEGKQILGVIDPIMKAVGMGRRGKSPCMKYCQCDDKKGSAAPMRALDDFGDDSERRQMLGEYYYDIPSMNDPAPMKEVSREKYDAMFGMTPEKKMAMGGRKRGSAAPISTLDDFSDDFDRRQMLGEYYYDIPSMNDPAPMKETMGGRKRSARKVVLLGGMDYVKSSDALMEADAKRFGLKSPMETKRMAVETARANAMRSLAPVTKGMGRIPRDAQISRGMGGASCGGKKPSARGAIVKKVMHEQGLSLPQASKYVKEHGLY